VKYSTEWRASNDEREMERTAKSEERNDDNDSVDETAPAGERSINLEGND
jgi:hypothetical protein